MPDWEYRVGKPGDRRRWYCAVGEFLQGLGKDGWELVNDHVCPETDEHGTTITVYGTFKRPAGK